jgi:uncharacterized membrane protein required for colicin V production
VIAAAAAAAPSAANDMPFNWFDMVLVLLLGFGLFRGRRNGMSKELLPTLQWLVVVPACGLGYPFLAKLTSGFIHDTLWNCIAAYLALALVVFIFFSKLKQQFGEKMGKSDIFKGGEYYLGMLAGLVRYACILMFAMALLNARVYTKMEIAKQRARDKADFGGGAGSSFQGNYFPHLFQIQDAVFKDSFLGSRIKTNVVMLLINTGKPGADSDNAPAPPKKQPVIKIGN